MEEWLLEAEVTPTSIITAQFNWDGSPRSRDGKLLRDTSAILKTMEAHGSIYFVIQDRKGASVPRLNIFQMMKSGDLFVWVISGKETLFHDVAAAASFIAADSGVKYGPMFYSESQLNRLRSLRSADTITKNDLLTYLRKVIALVHQVYDFAHQANDLGRPFGSLGKLFGYSDSKLHDFMVEVGYNPLVSMNWLDEAKKKYKDDPDVEPLFDHMN